jgi:hypothetical protein
MQLYVSNILPEFTYRLYRLKRASLNAFTSPEAFAAQFVFSPSDWNLLLAEAAKDKIALGTVSIADKQYLINKIKALLAAHLWRMEGYYQLQNATDSTVAKALQQLK